MFEQASLEAGVQSAVVRPLLLKGHERSITFIKYNREGDLLFTCSKDNRPTVWYSETGERLGTYEGHNGSVYCLDVSFDSALLITASTDQDVKLWEVKTGTGLYSWRHKGPVRFVQFNEGCTQFLSVTDTFAALPASINVYDLDTEEPTRQHDSPVVSIVDPKHPRVHIHAAIWGPLNKTIIASYSNGYVKVLDPVAGKVLSEFQAHTSNVTSLSTDKTGSFMLSTSVDNTALLWDLRDMTVLKTYRADCPLNAGAIAPLKDHVIIGGGQQADQVTTTAAAAGKFEVRFYHMVFEKELGRVKGHFGPVNTVAFHPDGHSFCSGAEDGYIRLHHLDPEYFVLGDELDTTEENVRNIEAVVQDAEEKLRNAGSVLDRAGDEAAGAAAGSATA